jgi:hypothetical protein
MLPAAIYGRSVISADGSALATAFVVTTLWLRGFLFPQRFVPSRLSFWMTLSALTKPTNVVFVLLGMTSLGLSARRWRLILPMILPAVAVALLWSLLSGADTAAWRMVEITGQNLVAFDPAVKISYLLDHPLHFPAAVLGTLHEKDFGQLWRQVVGVLGLFDTVLQPWVYPTVSALLLGTFFMRLPSRLPRVVKLRLWPAPPYLRMLLPFTSFAIWFLRRSTRTWCGACRGGISFRYYRSWRSWSPRWLIAPLTSGSARRWRFQPLCCQAPA